jgi:ATP-dependent RNA helicase SrmB
VLEQLPLDRRLRLGLDALGLEWPTEVQQRAIPAALAGADLRISAETGSGKTLAYLIPLAQRLLSLPAMREAGTLALVLVPTRELARQVLKQCRALIASSPLSAQAITGGADFRYQRALLRKNPEIVIATPGRLLEHCEKGSADLAALQLLVLDEADRMLDLGFRDDVLKIAGRCAPGRQVLMLSATLQHKGLGGVARALLDTPQTIAVGEARRAHGRIRHQRVLADNPEHKDRLLMALLEKEGPGRALVFANTRRTAERLARLLREGGLRSACLHGELRTEERQRVLGGFREGRIDTLCASDVAARGLDVEGVGLVVNYDLPHSGDDYLHRTGRTARAGASGVAVSLVGPPEWNRMIDIGRYLKLTFENRSLPGLKARYTGPARQRSSGRAVGSKKKRAAGAGTEKARTPRHGRAQRAGAPPAIDEGFAPLLRKRRDE